MAIPATPATPATSATPEQLLDRVQRSYRRAMGVIIPRLHEYFIPDHSLPGMVIEQASEFGLTLEEGSAALEGWRGKMIKVVDEVVARHMVEAKSLLRQESQNH